MHIKITPTRIKQVIERDAAHLGTTFSDLEGREQRVEIGCYLCVGIQGEYRTSSQRSMNEREAISEPDEEGFRLYRQRSLQPVLVVCIDEPFLLRLNSETSFWDASIW